MPISWNFTLVLLSVLVAIVGCFTALTHAQRMRDSVGRIAIAWMLIGGITLGLAIWSMHFIGMLAFHLPIKLNYDLTLTLLSALPAIAAAMLGFYVIREKVVSNLKIIIAGALMGIGIAVMHYSGMAALKMFPAIIYDQFYYVLSIIIAITASWGALFIMIHGEKTRLTPLLRFTLGSLIMGAAVSGMHYTGMQGIIIPFGSVCGAGDAAIDPNILAILVSLISLVWFGGGNIAALLDHRNAKLHMRSLNQLRKAHEKLEKSADEKAKEMTKDLRLSEAKTRAVINGALDCIITINSTGAIVEFNPAAERVFGHLSADVLGKNLCELIIPKRDREQHLTSICQHFDTNVPYAFDKRSELIAIRANGEEFPVELTLSSLQKGEDPLITGFLRDITESKKAEADIHSLAFYDPLTKLPNRRLLYDRLQHTVSSSTRHDQYVGILFIDLDNFKILNDTRGHDVGDLLLIKAADRLIKSVRNDDTVARLGGDEFVIILEGLSKNLDQAASQARAMGEKVSQSLNQPYLLQGKEHFSSPSIGICLFHNQEHSVDELLKRADTAMYQAKKAGRNTMCFFDPTMQVNVAARHALEDDLHQAIDQQHFQLYYQPQVNDKLKIVAAEALIRWAHPINGMILPDQFIPVAEETGLIEPIGQWILESACAQLKIWEADPKTAQLTLSVNISARQFRQTHFVEEVELILENTGASANKLKLELTESLILDNIEDSIQKILTLQKMGIEFSLDDFGTGYSSLSHLKRLPLTQLKIEKSFIQDIGLDKDDETIVQTIIGMAHTLNIEVVAEGIEKQEQHQFLIKNNCKLFQGHLFGKPMPIESFNQLLENGLNKTIFSEDSNMQASLT
jgi:diguanylate cyclase (GGDEF)-like protein/PAS domain S-box-containing protein